MDEPMPSTPAGDTIYEETNNSTQSERYLKNDGFVLAQPTVEKLVTPMIPSIEALVANNPPTQNVQDPFEDDGNPPTLDTQDPLV